MTVPECRDGVRYSSKESLYFRVKGLFIHMFDLHGHSLCKTVSISLPLVRLSSSFILPAFCPILLPCAPTAPSIHTFTLCTSLLSVPCLSRPPSSLHPALLAGFSPWSASPTVSIHPCPPRCPRVYRLPQILHWSDCSMSAGFLRASPLVVLSSTPTLSSPLSGTSPVSHSLSATRAGTEQCVFSSL